MEPPATIAPATPDARFVWDERFPRGRYRDTQTGRFVPWSTVRDVLDATLENTAKHMRGLGERLRGGSINLAEFQRQMERDVKSVHILSYALEKGGLQNLTPADYGRIGNALFNPNGSLDDGSAGQYAYLRRLAGEIEAGLPLDGRFLRRVEAYARAGRGTYHQAETRDLRAKGFDEERFLLHARDSCRTNKDRMGCIERAASGWAEIGALPNIGDAACYNNCRCSKEYRNTKTGEVFTP